MGLFAIGLYLPAGSGSIYDITLPPEMQFPLVGVLPQITSTTMEWNLVWFHQIPDPRQVVHTPAAPIGIDSNYRPVIATYAQMAWTYPTLKADQWYFLVNLYRLSRRNAGPATGFVAIQWPDPMSGQLQQASARWENYASVTRDVAAMHDITLTFSHLGIDNYPGTVIGTWQPPNELVPADPVPFASS